jgi:hypothetical protein
MSTKKSFPAFIMYLFWVSIWWAYHTLISFCMLRLYPIFCYYKQSCKIYIFLKKNQNYVYRIISQKWNCWEYAFEILPNFLTSGLSQGVMVLPAMNKNVFTQSLNNAMGYKTFGLLPI